MKNCKNCLIEFEPKHLTRGHEQLYCSTACRTKNYSTRILNKRMNDEKNYQNRDSVGISLPTIQNSINSHGSFLPSVNLEILEGKYQAKTEALEYKLRYEQSQRDLEAQKVLNAALRSELDEYVNDEGEDEGEGGLMGLMKNPEISSGIGKILQRDEIADFVVSFLKMTKK